MRHTGEVAGVDLAVFVFDCPDEDGRRFAGVVCNPELTLPEGAELGIEADSHITADGISVGTATLYDRKGPYGTGMVTAVSNPAAQIDFASRSRLV